MKNLFCAVLLTLFSLPAWAGTSVFGLELQKSTLQEAKQLYGGRETGINKFSEGPMLSVSPDKVGFEGLKELTLIFNRENKLVAVLSNLEKVRFNDVHRLLKDKYPIKSTYIPHVGNKKVLYSSGQDEIELNAPHMSFDMSLAYYTKQFLKSYETTIAKEEKQKRSQEAGRL